VKRQVGEGFDVEPSHVSRSIPLLYPRSGVE
jgi:hypothetical protein